MEIITKGIKKLSSIIWVFLNLWSDYSGLVQSKVPKEVLGAVQAVYNKSKQEKLLMKLHPEFENVRAGLINRKLVPTLDECLVEFLCEEHLASQHGIAQDTVSTEIFNMAYAA